MSALFSPALVFGFLLSLVYAALFHLWRGRSVGELILFILAAPLGFGLGQLAGMVTQIDGLQIGQVHTLEASVGAWAALILVRIAAGAPSRPAHRKD